MSRSRKKNWFASVNSRRAKTLANRINRRQLILARNGEDENYLCGKNTKYKRSYDRWNIRDYGGSWGVISFTHNFVDRRDSPYWDERKKNWHYLMWMK